MVVFVFETTVFSRYVWRWDKFRTYFRTNREISTAFVWLYMYNRRSKFDCLFESQYLVRHWKSMLVKSALILITLFKHSKYSRRRLFYFFLAPFHLLDLIPLMILTLWELAHSRIDIIRLFRLRDVLCRWLFCWAYEVKRGRSRLCSSNLLSWELDSPEIDEMIAKFERLLSKYSQVLV